MVDPQEHHNNKPRYYILHPFQKHLLSLLPHTHHVQQSSNSNHDDTVYDDTVHVVVATRAGHLAAHRWVVQHGVGWYVVRFTHPFHQFPGNAQYHLGTQPSQSCDHPPHHLWLDLRTRTTPREHVSRPRHQTQRWTLVFFLSSLRLHRAEYNTNPVHKIKKKLVKPKSVFIFDFP